MKQFTHVTVADLAAYRESPSEIAFRKVYSLYGLKKWITGMGELTPEGKARLKLWDGLGEATQINRALRDELRWIRRNGIGGANKTKRAKLEGHRLIDGEGLTERGKVLLDMFAGEDGPQ